METGRLPSAVTAGRIGYGLAYLAGGAVALGVAAVVLTGRRRFDRTVSALVDDLHAGREAASGATADRDRGAGGTVTADDLAGLPAPVERYLEAALAGDRRRVEALCLTQRGRLRLGEGPSAWKPFRATQRFAVDPPGFVWDATVAAYPGVSVRVVDAYVDGRGSLRARLLGSIPVASADPGPEMDEGELLRYLAESVWFPTALLADDVSWEAIDDRTARATVTDGSASASLVFRFGDDDLVASVHAEGRYRREDGRPRPWTGRFQDYQERSGLRVPTRAAVAWDLPEGRETYWRGRVETVDYAFAE